MKTSLLLIAALLCGCVAYPDPPHATAYPSAADPAQAQAAANARCARSGKLAVKEGPARCDGGSCTTSFECR